MKQPDTLDLPPATADDRRADAAPSQTWRKHWPAPVSLVLAVVYWIYLNEQVTREESAKVAIEMVNRRSDLAQKALNIRTPGPEYVITKIRDDSDKELDPETTKVLFKFQGPGGYFKSIETQLTLIVDVEIEKAVGVVDRRETRFRFTLNDVKDAKGELTGFITEMKPDAITVYVQRARTETLGLDPAKVTIQHRDDGEWDTRIDKDSLVFTPTFAILNGPVGELEDIGDRADVFVMDIADKLLNAKSWRPERKAIPAQLRLKQTWIDRGIRLVNQPTASVLVAPRAVMFNNFKVAVTTDWIASNLDRNEFKVVESVEVDVKSYNDRLTQILSSPAKAKRWVQEWVKCTVFAREIDSGLDHSQKDFTTYLMPHFTVFDDRFKDGRDVFIIRRDQIKVTRKTP